MAEEELPPGPVNPAVGRERSDANVAGIALFGVALILAAVLAHVVLYGMFRGLEKAQNKHRPSPPAIAGDLPHLPRDLEAIPEPRLQVRDVEDLRQLQARQDARLSSPPSWVDPAKGTVRIPIDEAMRLLTDPAVAARHGARTKPEKGK